MAERIAVTKGVSKASIAVATRSLGFPTSRAPASTSSKKIPDVNNQVHRLRFTPPQREGLPDTNFIEDRLRSLGDRLGQRHNCFGLDHRIQYILEQEGNHSLSRKPFYRLSQEPLILSNWERISALDFTPDTAADFASLLCGKRVAQRKSPMWADGLAGHVVIFDEVPTSHTWLADLRSLGDLGLSPLTQAVVTYARTVIAHPFTDGNGRFARALFYGPLARAELLPAPCLALGAILDLKREMVAEATICLAQSQRWSNYVQMVLDCVNLAADLVNEDYSS